MVLVVLSPVFFILWLMARRQLAAKSTEAANLTGKVAAMADRYAPIVSQDEEVSRLKGIVTGLEIDIQKLRDSYAEKRRYFDTLQEQVAIFDERLAFAEMGVYEPHFDFTDSEQFKNEILQVRARQKSLISDKKAAICPTEWAVEGSKAKGATMINRQIRLTLRAFNNECEAAIANVRWNNAVAMEKRIRTAAEAINKENASLNLTITDRYVSSKVGELRLTHELRETQKREKEDRAEMARAEREEKRLIAEAEAAEREERKYQALLEKVRKEADSDGNRKRISELEAALSEAHALSERARAMAELTKSGYVYIISNIGSFGEDVVKIGLTRRLDPDDRVRELGDASVPFSFDTHAMIYSDNAPTLENALHREFAARRINMSNFRKEFFKVTLDEVEAAVLTLAPDAALFKDREAQEWHETMARRSAALAELQAAPVNNMPMSI